MLHSWIVVNSKFEDFDVEICEKLQKQMVHFLFLSQEYFEKRDFGKGVKK